LPCSLYGISHKYIYTSYVYIIYIFIYTLYTNVQFLRNYKNIAAIYHNPVPVYISHYTCKHLKRTKETMLSKKKSRVTGNLLLSFSFSFFRARLFRIACATTSAKCLSAEMSEEETRHPTKVLKRRKIEFR